MFNKVTDFPQYRKLSNGKVYYKITDDRSFEEIQLMGSKAFLHTVIAQQYPEMIRIQDMLDTESEVYLLIDASEYEAIHAKCNF